MYAGSFDQQSNRADWEGSIYLWDGEVGTEEFIDISGCDISLSVRDERGGLSLSASTDDDTITLPEDGTLAWIFTASQMSALCPGTYQVGIRLTQADRTVQIVIGTLPVVEGVDQ